MNTYHIIDAASNTVRAINCLRENDIETVIRYYCADRYQWKRLGREEAEALSEHGIKIAVVYQNVQTRARDFSFEKGLEAGNDAKNYAQNVIDQPANSAIYFAVDYNASEEELENNIIPFFKGINEAMEPSGYSVGGYGSGLVVNRLYADALIKYRWLSASTSFRGTRAAIENGEFEMRQFFKSGLKLCGIGIDFDSTLTPETEIGTFDLE